MCTCACTEKKRSERYADAYKKCVNAASRIEKDSIQQDLMVTRKGQLNQALAMMHEGRYTVPLAIAVQDGNYIGETFV